MKFLRKNWKRIAATLLMIVLVAVLGYSIAETYNAYASMVVEQQQTQLLIVARAVSQNLDLYLTRQLRSMDVMIRSPGFADEFHRFYQTGEDSGIKEYIASYMLTYQQGLSRVYVLNREGEEIFRFNQYPVLEEFDESVLELPELSRRGQTGLGSVFPMGDHLYGLSLSNSVYAGSEFLGTVVGIINLEDVYREQVLRLDSRESDYIMIKDIDGHVIMHPNREMVGFAYSPEMNALQGDSRYAAMREMLRRQAEYEEGTALYRAYYGDILPAREELASYTRMNMSGTSLFISVVMPVEQALQLINENLGRFAMLAVVIALLLVSGAIIIYGLQKNRQRLQLQTRYLQNINHTLEELHQSREQVRHYQKLQTIGALAGGIAHEFNNLLTPIIGYCEFLKEQMGRESEYYDDLDEIHKAGARAKEIVEQILPFSRKERDKVGYRAVSVDTVVRDAIKMVRMVLPASIEMAEDIEETGANIFGSATQLHQVLLNLCTNAYQSMDREGGGMLTVTSRLLPRSILPERHPMHREDGQAVCITVSDTGCGMDEETQKQIFDPFFTTKAAGEGTGLGLSVVQSIIGNHGGHIEVESKPEQGSRFLVTLPLTDLPTVPAADEDKQELQTGASVLLVDDNPRVVQYLKRRLTKAGCQVDDYVDSREAMKALSHTPERWNLLLVDYTMPGFRGTELAETAKRLRPDLPTVLITGLVEKEALEYKQSGILDEIIIKPIDFEELMETITHLLEKRAR